MRLFLRNGVHRPIRLRLDEPMYFSNISTIASVGAAACFVTTLMASPILAADLDPSYADIPEAIPQQNVSFGSGWYIRGDIGVTRLPQLSIKNPTVLPTRENPQAIPTAPSPTIKDSAHAGYVASLGGGYQFNQWFRVELIGDFHQPLKTSSVSGNGNVFCITGVSYPNQIGANYGTPVYANGGCTGNYKATLDSYDVMANGYVDLGTWYRVTPYVGAGAGLSFGHYQSSATYVQANNVPYQITYTDPKYGATFAPNYDRVSSGQYYNFAWALMAGFAVDVYSHTKVDIGYRYLNLGSVPGLGGPLTTQEVRAGIRYMLDN